ncbi:glycerophosphodiester phosphodiesterase [Paenibacillus sp. NPDC058071]|uniref:glycerophosphodiester phosphodiesterase n=1 Tax=Paenibacillus sp. NPDC058071 TaxID=3346326 RepID=UPI0036DD9659
MTKPINYAHRGASAYCPENTMAAFEKGLALGATGIETDVQMTRDGRLVLIHDEKLSRTAGLDDYVANVDYNDLKKLDAGSWFGEAFAGETIPSLEELLDFVRQRDTIINLELKNGLVLYPGMEQKVVEVVRAFGLSERIIVSSFNHYSLVAFKSLAPDIATGILYMEGLYEPWNYAKTVGATTLHAPYYAVLPEWVAEATKQGIVFNPFTVNDPETMKKLIASGVAGIITDYPDRLAALL